MTHPHSGGSGGNGPGGNQWWLVSWFPSGSVSSRLVAPAQPNYRIVEAPTAQKAKDQVKNVAEGQPVNADGPFKTRADAQAAESDNRKKIAKKEQAGSLPNLNPLSGIEGLFSGFFQVLTDGKMWRSLGWIVLGLVLLFMGVSLWLKLPQKAFSMGEKAATVAAVA
jgi:hypothetical protein